MSVATPIARPRLAPPRANRNWINRSSLLVRMSDANLGAATLVVAPTGFGKSGLLTQWAAGQLEPVAWLTLTSDDDSLTTFTVMLANAVNAVIPSTVLSPLHYLEFIAEPPDAATIATHLLNELSDLPRPLAIVLDDLHTVANPDVHEVILRLAMAATPDLRLLVGSRHDPPWPLTQMRASGRLSEVRSSDLLLTPSEVMAYATRTGWSSIRSEDAQTIWSISRGWLTGVRFLCASRDRIRDSSMHAREIDPDLTDEAMAWLLTEAVASYSDEERSLVMRLAIPPRVNWPLAKALGEDAIDHDHLGTIYDQLVADGLLLSPADDAGWSMMHAQVRQTLLEHLATEIGEDGVRRCHEIACAYFAGQALFDEAIEHAWLAGGAEMAARLLPVAVAPTLANDGWPRVEAWLAAMPTELVRQIPELMIAHAWVARKRDSFENLDRWIAETRSAIDADGGQLAQPRRDLLLAELDVLEAESVYFLGDLARVERLTAHATTVLTPEQGFALSEAYMYLVFSTAIGDPTAGLMKAAAIVADTKSLPPVVALNALFAYAYVTYQSGDLRRAAKLANQLRDLAEGSESTLLLAWADTVAALSAYELNDLDDVVAHATLVLERTSPVNRIAVREAQNCLALTYEAKGQHEDADLVLDRLEELSIQELAFADLIELNAVRAWFALRRGDTAHASAWYARAPFPETTAPTHSLVDARILQIAVAVSLGIDLDLARSRIEQCLQAPSISHLLIRRVNLISLRAIIKERTGDPAGAIADLREAIQLGASSGLTRIYLDYAADLQPLLERIEPSDALAPEVTRLLGLMAQEAPAARPIPYAGNPARQPSASLDALSEREIDVFQLVAQRLTNKEIGEELSISPLTVKRHTVNICAKLGVTSRRQAIAVAQGAFPSTPRFPDLAS